MALTGGNLGKTGGKFTLTEDDISGSMAQYIDKEMKDLYEKLKGTSFPSGGGEDRRMLFTAISRGILKYFKTNQDDLINVLTATHDPSTIEVDHTVSELDLDIVVDALPT